MIAPLVDEETWIRTLENAPVWAPSAKPMVVIAPHPDDETLGLGGLIAAHRRRSLPVRVICVTDGEAAYENTPGLAEVRIAEQELALEILGVSRQDIIRLKLPDSAVSNHEQQLASCLSEFLQQETLVLAPWTKDWHPDHEACGRAAEQVCSLFRAELVYYLFWTWHQASPESLGSEAVRRFELTAEEIELKKRALGQHRSQLYRENGSPILPDHLLGPINRPFETFIYAA